MQWMQWNSGIWWGHCLWCKKVKLVDAVHSEFIGILVYGDWDIVFDTKRSLVQKGQTSGFSGCSHAVNTVHSGHSMQWMQYTVDAVCSGIVLYGGGNIAFDTEGMFIGVSNL